MHEHSKTYQPIHVTNIAFMRNTCYKWICSDCLAEGIDYRWHTQGYNDYDELVRKHEDNCNQDIAFDKWKIERDEQKKYDIHAIAL
jgi:hypothetical protein